MQKNVKRLAAFILVMAMCLNGISSYVTSKAAGDSKSNVALATNGTTIYTDMPNGFGEDNGYSLKNLIDGDTNAGSFGMTSTRGSDATVVNIVLGFKQAYSVDSVVIYKSANGGFPVNFVLSAYTQNGWQEVVKKENYAATDGANTFDFTGTVDCSAIRLTVTKHGLDAGGGFAACYLSEIAAYGVESSANIPADYCVTNAAAAANGAEISTDAYNTWTDGDGAIYHISKMIDGKVQNGSFGVTSVENENQEANITVRFAGTYHIDTVRLFKACDGGFPIDFTIDVLSGDKWKTVCTKTGYSAVDESNIFTFTGVDCTAVRLHVTKNGLHNDGVSYRLYFTEIEAWGRKVSNEGVPPVNVAKNAGTVFTTSHPSEWGENNGYGIANLNDGLVDKGYFFVTGTTAQWENIDMQVCAGLDKTYRINEVRLYKSYDGGFPVDFTISVYTKAGWDTVLIKTGYESVDGWNIFEFDAVDCSAVRLTATKQGMITTLETYGIYLQEFEIYGVESLTTIPAPHATSNVALKTNNTTASTSHVSTWNEENGYGVSNLNNGNTEDLFGTAQSAEYQLEPINVDLNFDGVYKVNEVRLFSYTEATFPIDFTISAYTGNGWETVVNKENYSGTAGANTFWFDEVECTAIRLRTTKNGYDATIDTYGIYLREFEVYGVKSTASLPASKTPANVALSAAGTTVTTNHPNGWAEQNGYGIANINDDDTKTLFMTAMEPGYENLEMNVTFNFNGVYSVNEVKLYAASEGAFPVDFRLEAYTAEGWQSVLTKQGYQAVSGANAFTFNSVDCSALRLVSTKNGKSDQEQYGIYLNEIEILGLESEVEVPVRRNCSAGSVILSNGTNHAALTDNMVGTEAFYTSQLVQVSSDKVNVQFFFETLNIIDSIRLYAHEDGKLPGSLEIYAFTGNAWEKIKDYTVDSQFRLHEVSFDKVSCSSIMLVATGLYEMNNAFGMELDEIWIYGAKTTDTTGLLGDGNADNSRTEAEDLKCMRQQLVTADTVNARMDMNCDMTNSVTDLVRMKRYFAECREPRDYGYYGTVESTTWNKLFAN